MDILYLYGLLLLDLNDGVLYTRPQLLKHYGGHLRAQLLGYEHLCALLCVQCGMQEVELLRFLNVMAQSVLEPLQQGQLSNTVEYALYGLQ